MVECLHDVFAHDIDEVLPFAFGGKKRKYISGKQADKGLNIAIRGIGQRKWEIKKFIVGSKATYFRGTKKKVQLEGS